MSKVEDVGLRSFIYVMGPHDVRLNPQETDHVG